MMYTGLDYDLDKMKTNICEPIMNKIQKTVEEFFPIDMECYQECIDRISVHPFIPDVLESNKIMQPFFLNETGGDIVKMMQLTFDRYGCFPMSLIQDIFRQSKDFEGFICKLKGILEKDFDKLSASERVCYGICQNVLEKIENVLNGIQELSDKGCFHGENIVADNSGNEEIYVMLIGKINEINGKFREIVDRIGLEDLENLIEENINSTVKEKKPEKLSQEEKKELEEEWNILKFELQCKLRWWLSNDFFIHRCKCYANRVEYKTISRQDFIQLCKKEESRPEVILDKNIEKCITAFKIIQCCEDDYRQTKNKNLRYPKVLEDGLIHLIADKDEDVGTRLSIFSAILDQSKKLKQNEKEISYRQRIAELERDILSENYNYELCCAWNDLGGFSLSAIIVGKLLRYNLIAQSYVLNSQYKEQREKFFEALERCCEILVYFSQSESWLMGLELACIILNMYTEHWRGKSPTLEELYISMGYMADILESIPLQDILRNYPYEKEQMMGRDGFPRKDFEVLWRDEKNMYQHFFYRKKDELKKYTPRSVRNTLYMEIFRIVFRCVNRVRD
ncbi:MAG: hypothetical protein NC489_40890 [Ruminococcus flavefaciens]|nr:hypothetical protein [Ruminococcus flavefaciens]